MALHLGNHTYDPASGWCTGCNRRDDGRALTPGGKVLAQGDSPQRPANDPAQFELVSS